MLSVRAKEAIKTALAVTLAYWGALSLGWDKPYWAALAVVMVSLSTAGQSLNKAAMRMFGTLLAVVFSLIVLGLFLQDRWAFALCLSLYLGFCTYMLAGPKRSYFWFVAAFVAIVIMIDGSSDPANTFETAMLRAQETGLGILIYSVVAALLWPRRSGPDLEQASRALFATQRSLYEAYRELTGGQGSLEEARALEAQQVQQLAQLAPALAGATSDTFEVWEARQAWRRFSAESGRLGEILSRWRESLPELERIDVEACLPNLRDLFAELDARFDEIERTLAGGEPTREPAPITPGTDAESLEHLTHFDKAALAVTLGQLRGLDSVSRALLETTRELREPAQRPESRAAPPLAAGLRLDPERLEAAVSIMATAWIALLIWFYVDPPNDATFVQTACIFAMGAAMVGARPQSLLLPFGFGLLAYGLFYVFVMPQLSGFRELGPALFGAFFLINYLFWQPQQGLMKLGVSVCFVAVAPISNEQTYSFASFAAGALMNMMGIALVVVTEWIPRSPLPEKRFLRLVARFFRHAELLISRVAPEPEPERRGVGRRWREALYGGDLQGLPPKLAALAPRLDFRVLPGSSPEQVQALVTSLQALAYRLAELDDVRRGALDNELVRELADEVREWRDAVGTTFGRLGDDPAQPLDPPALRSRLDARLDKLQARVEETVGRARERGAAPEDYESFYRLLGSFRGMSEAAQAYAQLASGMRWAPWQEARF